MGLAAPSLPRAPDLIGGLHVHFVHCDDDSDPTWPSLALRPARPPIPAATADRPLAADAAVALRRLLRHRLRIAGEPARQVPIGALLNAIFRPPGAIEAKVAAATLTAFGIRPMTRCLSGDGFPGCYYACCRDNRGRAVPRGAAGDGLWLLNRAAMLALFGDTDLGVQNARRALLALPGARRSAGNVRVGQRPGPAIWLAWSDLLDAAPDRPP